MTDSTPADRFAWGTSADHRDEETRSDVLVRGRAAAAGLIAVHGSRDGTRFHTDRA